jgi:fumarate reductase subunit D
MAALSSPVLRPPHAAESVEKIIYLVCLTVCIELVFFKFLPDIATAVIQGGTSNLSVFTIFEQTYLRPGSVHHARFLGNDILYYLARHVAAIGISQDIRLYPLRIAAGILTPLYATIGAIPVLRGSAAYDWRAFFIPYALSVIMGLYVFYPGDMPGLAFLSVGLFYVLQERLLPALSLMLVVGLFRETSFHLVWFVAAWAICTPSPPLIRRASWVFAFAAAFAVEYWVIRTYFPGPLSSSGGLILDPWQLFFGRGIWSLTTLCSLSLAALFPILCWVRLSVVPVATWQSRFFSLNCAVFPLWVVLYRMLSGNVSEFRILLPAILPCIYGISYTYGVFACARTKPTT